MSGLLPSPPDDSSGAKVARLNASFEQSRLRLTGIQELTQSIFKNLILLNGGAIVSIFTIMGHDKNVISSMVDIKWSFAALSIGLIFTMTAMALSFFAQNIFFLNENKYAHAITFQLMDLTPPDSLKAEHVETANGIRVGAIVSAVIAIGCFILGSYFALVSVSIK